MATQIKTWEIVDGRLREVTSSLSVSGRTEPYDLEEWIASNPEILGTDIVIIGRQVPTRSGPLDLLGIDKSGNIVIVELKRDQLPRESLSQAIDYVSDVAQWSLEKISEFCAKYTGKALDEFLSEAFEDIDIESLNINQTQRILLVGFSIEDSLERMVSWLSDNFNVNINAIVLHYTKTQSGTELLSKTTIIPEELEKERAAVKKFTISMSDEPGSYSIPELKEKLRSYFSQQLKSARRIKEVLLPVYLKSGVVTREELKKAFIEYNEPNAEKNAGYFVSLISVQIGMARNDFLRQIISYEYPNNPWEKDNYRIRDEYKDLVRELLAK